MAADDNVDFRFLGKQVQRLQADVRDLRSGHLHLEGEVAGMRADMSRLEERMDGVEVQLTGIKGEVTGLKGEVLSLSEKIDNHHRANQAQLKQMSDSNSTILQVIITKLDDIESSLPPRI